MNKYDESSITILEGLEAVRKRPGMYIGSTDKRGLHHLAWEIIDNSVDEIINGFGNKITVKINKDNINIIIENYISGSVLDNNPLLHTTKENSFEHGFGIKNIKYIINSLGGMVEFFEEGNSFFAQILL